MKSRSNYLNAVLLIIALSIATVPKAMEPLRRYYLIKVYHYKTSVQEGKMDHYLKDAYLPALRKITGEPVGVFKSMDQDTDKRIYILITSSSRKKLESLDKKLSKNQEYLENAKDYLDASYDNAPYTRFETIELYAFQHWKMPWKPQLTAKKSDRVYELRSYESPTEKYNLNKVKMFNDGDEIGLFSRLKFNAVFYAEVLSGSHMPNLMYMTTFNSKEDRDKHWDAFFGSPEWKKLIADPQYAHNVSKADIIFLHPAEYSDF